MMNIAGLLGYMTGFLTNAAIFTLFVLGLNLQFGFTGLINFGHVAFMGIGAYTMALLSLAGWSLWLAVPAGVLVAGLFGLLIGIPSIRLREDYLAIVTIGFAEIVRMVINNETQITGGPLGIRGYAVPLRSLEVTPLEYRLLFLLLCVVVTAAVFIALQYSINTPWGRVLKAIREDEDVALALGKNTVAYKLQAFAIGAAVAGLAGILMAWFLRFMDPRNFMPLTTFIAWMIMVLGGTGRNWGAVLGSLVYFGIFSATRGLENTGYAFLSGAQVGAIRLMLIGLLLVLLMMYRPQGLLGRKEELSLDR